MLQSWATPFNRVKEENKTLIQSREAKIKSAYKGENKERKQESQRGIFGINIVCKVSESVKKLQNENKQANVSSIKTSRKPSHNECNNKKNKDNTIKILTYCLKMHKNAFTNSCWKIVW